MWNEFSVARLIPPVRPEQSGIGADLARMYRSGELPEKDYYISNASWIAQNLEQYPLEAIPAPNEALSSYITRRKHGGPFEQAMSRRLSGWFFVMSKLNQDNEANLKLIEWAKAKLEAGGFMKHLPDCAAKIAEFSAKNKNIQKFNDAIFVLGLDSSEKPKATGPLRLT